MTLDPCVFADLDVGKSMTNEEKKAQRRARRYVARAFGRKLAASVPRLSRTEVEGIEFSRERARIRDERRGLWSKVIIEEGAELVRRVVERLAALPGVSLWDSVRGL